MLVDMPWSIWDVVVYRCVLVSSERMFYLFFSLTSVLSTEGDIPYGNIPSQKKKHVQSF